ncbi:MAG: MFS transporter [Chloroflexi bacterium]|nr:MFS transporter [Chloroflexota bacterium]
MGGLLLGWTGTASVYFVNAALFVPALIAVAVLAAPRGPAEHRPSLRPTAIVEGLRFFLSARVIMALVLLDVGATVFGNYQVLLPIFAKDILAVGETGFGALNAAPALGALLGASTLLLLKVRRAGILVIASVFAFALALAGFGWSTWFALSLLFAAALGYLDALGVVIRQTMVQTLTPDHLRGRTTAVSTMFSAGAPSLGGVISGFAAGLLGAGPAVLLGSILVGVATAGITAVFGSLRRLRTT